ncbi:MAG: branched-chain amino acid ABC transporter permease [Ketobacteraceae bacterium]|nr:branched-chain amino acid ABC transporter permease [Ketobacteraceae bacterium]
MNQRLAIPEPTTAEVPVAIACNRLFLSRSSLWLTVVLIAVLLTLPLFAGSYWLSLLIQVGYLAIAAMGLNLLVGYSGQISLGHGAFFGFGAFASAWLNNTWGIPVIFCIPLAGLMTMAVGTLFGAPAARLKGLYLAIATLSAQYIIEDFFVRAEGFTGGVSGSLANPVNLFGFEFYSDERFFYLVLAFVLIMFIAARNIVRTRAGRAMVAVRDHHLSAEIMGIHLTGTRILAFALASFYAGIGGALFGHYLGFVSIEGFTILMSIQFLAIIIIGGLGTIRGALLGAVFIVGLPELMQVIASVVGEALGGGLAVTQAMPFVKEISIGVVIILFLLFEPHGLVNRWEKLKRKLKSKRSAGVTAA